MKVSNPRSFLYLALVAALAVTAGGCGPEPSKLDKNYASKNIQKIGVVVWCTSNESDGLPQAPTLTPVPSVKSKTKMVREAECDGYFTPKILPHILATVRGKGYTVVDLTDRFTFGPEATLKQNLEAVKTRGGVDAVLIVPYVYSSLYYKPVGYSSIATPGSVCLLGNMTLHHVTTGKTLWAAGADGSYLKHTPPKGVSKYAPLEEIAGPVCREFGTYFGVLPKHPFPPRGGMAKQQ